MKYLYALWEVSVFEERICALFKLRHNFSDTHSSVTADKGGGMWRIGATLFLYRAWSIGHKPWFDLKLIGAWQRGSGDIGTR